MRWRENQICGIAAAVSGVNGDGEKCPAPEESFYLVFDHAMAGLSDSRYALRKWCPKIVMQFHFFPWLPGDYVRRTTCFPLVGPSLPPSLLPASTQHRAGLVTSRKSLLVGSYAPKVINFRNNWGSFKEPGMTKTL